MPGQYAVVGGIYEEILDIHYSSKKLNSTYKYLVR